MEGTDDRKLLFIDIETTGLIPDTKSILEVGAVVVDHNLEPIEVLQLVLGVNKAMALEEMDAWCLETHTRSGLLKECCASTLLLSDAENQLIDLCLRHFPLEGHRIVMAGASIHFDRSFLDRYMPVLTNTRGGRMHFHMVDTTSFKEANRVVLGPELHRAQLKKPAHRALPDVLDSLNHLRKEYGFKPLESLERPAKGDADREVDQVEGEVAEVPAGGESEGAPEQLLGGDLVHGSSDEGRE